ncbi:putative Secreted effector protein PipB [Pseudodesulfovibrio profundus]|uniref:Putative Secreted effector protein PipB n=1 Tax=Pseudodesulfovibrio profundus TaxID=57320 RepID=A0A2C8FDI2_9BACT|nr:putative Secreted effector protein PipB [Pseudodesulfovibrio profundus]
MKPDLKGANLREAFLQGAILYSADLQGADLKGADLKGADLLAASLEGADLSGAYLKGARLTSANLNMAFLIEAHLEGARLNGAQLKGAILYLAHLEGANLIQANLDGASVQGVTYDNAMRCRVINVQNCVGSQRFIRHVADLDYIEETREKHPVKHFLWSYTSDCGCCWELLFVWCVFIVGLFAVFFDWAGTPLPLISSIMAFTSFGFIDANAHSTGELILICVEAMLGFVMFGCLVSLISSMMARRSG